MGYSVYENVPRTCAFLPVTSSLLVSSLLYPHTSIYIPPIQPRSTMPSSPRTVSLSRSRVCSGPDSARPASSPLLSRTATTWCRRSTRSRPPSGSKWRRYAVWIVECETVSVSQVFILEYLGNHLGNHLWTLVCHQRSCVKGRSMYYVMQY